MEHTVTPVICLITLYLLHSKYTLSHSLHSSSSFIFTQYSYPSPMSILYCDTRNKKVKVRNVDDQPRSIYDRNISVANGTKNRAP